MSPPIHVFISISAFLVAISCLPGSAQAQREFVSGEEADSLEALAEAEMERFGHAPAPPSLEDSGPHVRRRLPSALTSDARITERTSSGTPVPWLSDLNMPDLPVQWRQEVIDYLSYFRDSPQGQRLMRAWFNRSTRYGPMIRETLQRHGLPEDLRCVAMAESGFDPTVRSSAGAVGMWQFVGVTGREYGLNADRWVDERMDPVASTAAAARYLGDLRARLGRWELALAAYNMGYPALLRAIRKYNTNDYWTLASLEAGLPFETTIYVAKIMACTVVMRNPERFGFDPSAREAPLEAESFQIGGGVNLRQLARAAGTTAERLSILNPHLLRGRTPPRRQTTIHIPRGQADSFARAWRRVRTRDETTEPYVMRFGETLDRVARRYRMSQSELRALNGLAASDRVSAGTVLLVNAVEPREVDETDVVVAVPPRQFSYEGRQRIFYPALGRDTVEEIARFFGVHPSDVREWNGLDPMATIHSGMILQLFVDSSFDLSTAWIYEEDDVTIRAVGSEDFFNEHEAGEGRIRFVYTVREGDSMRSLANRFELSTGSIARINRFSRRADLLPGQQLVIYTSPERVPAEYRRTIEAEENRGNNSLATEPSESEND